MWGDILISIFFQGFVKRQKTFTQEWFFECGCPRCSDPTGPSMSFYLNFVQILSKYKKLTFSNFIYSHIWVPLAPNMFALQVWGGTGSSLWLKCLEGHIRPCSEGHLFEDSVRRDTFQNMIKKNLRQTKIAWIFIWISYSNFTLLKIRIKSI